MAPHLSLGAVGTKAPFWPMPGILVRYALTPCPLPALPQALPSEKGNLLHVPQWVNEDPQDSMVRHFVEVLLESFGSLDPHEDVRARTAAASERLHAMAVQLAQERQGTVETGVAGAAAAAEAGVRGGDQQQHGSREFDGAEAGDGVGGAPQEGAPWGDVQEAPVQPLKRALLGDGAEPAPAPANPEEIDLGEMSD
jgi:hypothetical protein